MKTLTLTLILISFLQETFIGVDLVLLVLICRAYIKTEKKNLYLAFGFGLLNSHLTLNSLGVKSLVYLLLVQLTQLLSRSRLAGNSLMIIPVSFILLSINEIINSTLFGIGFQIFPKVAVESFLALPVFYIVRLWEERFIVRKDIKLKI